MPELLQLTRLAPTGTVAVPVASLAAFTVAQPDRTYVFDDLVRLTAQTDTSQNATYRVGAVVGGAAPLTLAVAGTVETVFLGGRPTACRVDLYAGKADPLDDTKPLQKLSAGVGVVDPVNTTIAAAAEPGDSSVVVTSATGILVGRRYLVGSQNAAEACEDVIARAIDGTTILFWGALAYRHASGAAFAGLRVSLAIGAGAAAPNAGADELWGAGYAIFTPDPASGLDQQQEVCDCLQFPIPKLLCAVGDVRLAYQRILEIIDTDTDLAGVMRTARDEMLLDLGRARARYTIGASEFRRAAALKTLLLLQHNVNNPQLSKSWQGEYEQIIARIRAAQPADRGGDGIADEADPEDGTSSDIMGMSATDVDVFERRNPLTGIFDASILPDPS